MIINSPRSTSIFFCFCLFSILLLPISCVNGQNDPQQQAQQQQQINSKVNSININSKSVTNNADKLEAPASDSVVVKKKYSNLNNKYETQSSVTSTTSVGLYPGQKKSEYIQ